MIRGFPVLLALLLVATGIPLEQSPEVADATVITEIFPETASSIPPDLIEKKNEKLEDEIYKMGQVMPETVIVQENADVRINDEMDLKKRIENFTVAKFRILTTETSKIVGDASIDSVGGLEPEDDGEQARQTSEKELAELSDRLREKEDSKKEGAEKTDIDEEQKIEEREEEAVKTKSEMDELVTKGPEVEEVGRKSEEESVEEKKDEPKKEATFSDSIMPEEPDLMKADDKEAAQASDVVPEELDGDRISWDLVEFLIMLTPTDKDVSWWTIIVEAVKCSLRSCSSARSHWQRHPVYLPRITRHRREDTEFELNQIQTTPKTCVCQNLEAYFEQMYETIGKKKKAMNETVF